MATINSFTSLEQSRKLADILPLESSDMYWDYDYSISTGKYKYYPKVMDNQFDDVCIHCWSLTALLKYLSEINPQVYTPILFPSEGKWILQFVEYGHENVCEMSCENPVDACYYMILKLNEVFRYLLWG